MSPQDGQSGMLTPRTLGHNLYRGVQPREVTGVGLSPGSPPSDAPMTHLPHGISVGTWESVGVGAPGGPRSVGRRWEASPGADPLVDALPSDGSLRGPSAQDISNFKARLDSGTKARPLEVTPGGVLLTSIPHARLPTRGSPASAWQGGHVGTRDTRLPGAEPSHTAAALNEAGRAPSSGLCVLSAIQVLGLRTGSRLLEHRVLGALLSICRARLDINTAF